MTKTQKEFEKSFRRTDTYRYSYCSLSKDYTGGYEDGMIEMAFVAYKLGRRHANKSNTNKAKNNHG